MTSIWGETKPLNQRKRSAVAIFTNLKKMSLKPRNGQILHSDSLSLGFTGKNIGETYAIVNYFGKSDTIYFVIDSINSASGLKTWMGSIDDNWNIPGNWSTTGVPVSTNDVLIPSATPNQPVVRIPGLSCNNLFIENGATVIVQPGKILTTNGDVVMEGP